MKIYSEVQTVPCPYCRSFKTRTSLGVRGDVLMRWCMTCHRRWDYEPEFAPRRRRKVKQ